MYIESVLIYATVNANRSMASLPVADACVGKLVGNDAKFAWIFTGMGPQWVDMGREVCVPVLRFYIFYFLY